MRCHYALFNLPSFKRCVLNKETKDNLAKKIKELRRKVFKAKKFEKKKDWKDFRANINKEKINEQ